MAKPIRDTRRAEFVIRERLIENGWVEFTAREPDWSEPDPLDETVDRRLRVIAERGGRVLRVACVENPEKIRTISAFIDRGALKPE